MKAISRTVYVMVPAVYFGVRQDKCMKDSGVSERGKIVIWFIHFTRNFSAQHFMWLNIIINMKYTSI